MEQLAEDLSLLGLPFLLGRAAEAAAEYEAGGCALTASAFVRAAIALKSLLNHPELAALEEDTSEVVVNDSQQLNDSPEPADVFCQLSESPLAGQSLICDHCMSC